MHVDNMFIKLTIRALEGYHPSDPEAFRLASININSIDYFFDIDEGSSIVCINGREFKCKTPAEVISRSIDLALYIDENLER